jgi:Sulfotransferase domain
LALSVLPNAVIAGAPKSGTTSLFRWLTDHPDVCGSAEKETHYLVDPDYFSFRADSNYHDHGLAGYSSHFEPCRAGRSQIVLEATPAYLYQHTAPAVLSDLDPVPHVLFIFRKPSERAHSHFRFYQDTKAMIDRRLSFGEFVELARSDDPRLHRLAEKGTTKILENSRYAEFLPPWLDRFPRERLHFFLFEDLRRDPGAFAATVASRLGIDPAFFDGYDFRPRNKSFRVRSAWLHNARRRAGRHVSARTRRRLKRVTAGAYAFINVEGGRGAPTREEASVIAELDVEFEPYNEKLGELTGLDLGAWA